MVSTRGHPRSFPAPTTATSTPASSTRSSTGRASSPTSPSSTSSSSTAIATTRRSMSSSTPSSSSSAWTHTPSNLTLIWLAVSLPLVLWDTGYVLLRPHTLPGGALHAPIWTPYALYGTVDYVYSARAYHERFGFTGAQAFLNTIETAGYLVYLWLVFARGKEIKARGRGAPKKNVTPGVLQRLVQARTLGGLDAAWAVVLAFSMAVMTVSKTLLYWMVQYYSDYADIGHNDLYSLVVMWIIPNGAWLVLPSYMIYVYGAEILQGLSIAAATHQKRS